MVSQASLGTHRVGMARLQRDITGHELQRNPVPLHTLTVQTPMMHQRPRVRTERCPVLRNFKSAAGRGPALFEPVSGTRDLRVVLDEAAIPIEGDDMVRARDLLSGLLSARGVRAWRYDGRPRGDGVEDWLTNPSQVREGWVEATAAGPGSPYTHDVVYRRDQTVTAAAISGDVARGELAVSEPTYAHLSPEVAAERRNADAMLLGAADAAGADLLVTERPFLLGGHWFASLPPLPCTTAEGISLVSQFLRLRGTYPADATEALGITLHFNRGLFFWVGTRALLPEGWRWFSHCVEAEADTANVDLVITAQSVFQRIQRSLIARDTLRWHLTLHQDNDVADDELAEVDRILVYLVGAFDAVARVAHRVLGIAGPEYGAGWQKGSWLTRVSAEAPALAAVMAPSGEAADLFEVIRLMRNSVHGAGLQALGLSRGVGRREGTAVSLPIGETGRLLEILEARDWSDVWGLSKLTEGRFFVRPDAFIEHLVRATFPVLNELMRLTPVELLLDHPTASTGSAPSDGPFAYGDSVLLQLGFDPAHLA